MAFPQEEQQTRAPHAGSAELFRVAIEEDPTFASAHNMLGWAVRLDSHEEALTHWTRAVELSADLPERDRLFIEGTLRHQTGQYEQALSLYEALAAVHPDHHG